MLSLIKSMRLEKGWIKQNYVTYLLLFTFKILVGLVS